MSPDNPPTSRREFLATLSLSALGTALPSGAGAAETSAAGPVDPVRELQSNRANLGSLWPDVQKLADANRYSFSSSSGRFKTFAEFQVTAREKLLEVLLYQPAPVEQLPEVIVGGLSSDEIRLSIRVAASNRTIVAG
jgi:ABC-type transporter Mla subunit MlaD